MKTFLCIFGLHLREVWGGQHQTSATLAVTSSAHLSCQELVDFVHLVCVFVFASLWVRETPHRELKAN